MPLPEYQRLLGSWLLTLTASTFEAPSLAFAVRSHSKDEYPYGRAQICVPFSHTVLSMYTPSNCTNTFWPELDCGSVNVLRYQPRPPSRYPPPAPDAELWLNGNE